MLLIFATLLYPAISNEYFPATPHVWVEITKPMLSCYTLNDDWKLKLKTIKKMQESLAYWSSIGFAPNGCEVLKVGRKLELSIEQPFDAVHFNDYCIPGCSPYEWDAYSPTEKLVGEYMKPSSIPDQYKDYLIKK